MVSYKNCPFGRISCDGCNQLMTGGCALSNHNAASSITNDDMVALYDRRKEELMKLSKEDLVELIIGKREYVGKIFGKFI